MPVTQRASIAIHGPSGGSSSYMAQEIDYVVNQYATTALQSASVANSATPYEQTLFVMAKVPAYTSFGSVGDVIPAGGVIATVNQVRIVTAITSSLLSVAGVSLGFNLRRGGAVVGGGPFAGWTTGTVPTFNAFVPQAVPFITTNTALTIPPGLGAVSATNALLPLQPDDVITLTLTQNSAAPIVVPFFTGYVDVT